MAMKGNRARGYQKFANDRGLELIRTKEETRRSGTCDLLIDLAHPQVHVIVRHHIGGVDAR